jgi:hypothetical protein
MIPGLEEELGQNFEKIQRNLNQNFETIQGNLNFLEEK